MGDVDDMDDMGDMDDVGDVDDVPAGGEDSMPGRARIRGNAVSLDLSRSLSM